MVHDLVYKNVYAEIKVAKMTNTTKNRCYRRKYNMGMWHWFPVTIWNIVGGSVAKIEDQIIDIKGKNTSYNNDVLIYIKKECMMPKSPPPPSPLALTHRYVNTHTRAHSQ